MIHVKPQIIAAVQLELPFAKTEDIRRISFAGVSIESADTLQRNDIEDGAVLYIDLDTDSIDRRERRAKKGEGVVVGIDVSSKEWHISTHRWTSRCCHCTVTVAALCRHCCHHCTVAVSALLQLPTLYHHRHRPVAVYRDGVSKQLVKGHHCTITAPSLHHHCKRMSTHKFLNFLISNHHCTITAPSLHHHCTITAPSPHHHCTITAPSLHRHCTITAPSLLYPTITAPSLHHHW